ncbi:peroxiredoxin-like family protein [Mycobacterium sp. E3198]|uniref:peroxiredoxin-like family protein n=1 Tax=Mycobacterium sp. E3198 TaxID=1834143 RepID=UPI00080028C8|nr:peroxiredoxin-like family protein [Mycobacterium sp. E3198]OBG41555.1 alkyl hydroperoxide reductase [Mycobacterium sp. E3198]
MPEATAARLSVGDRFPHLELTGIDDEPIAIPDPAGALTHLQFRRFAGCPICDLHLRSITARLDEIAAAGIREVVVFHSSPAELRKYEKDLPFPVIGDPGRKLYRRFGVEASAKSVLSPGAWRALPRGLWHAFRTALSKRRAPVPAHPTNGNLGLPADVLIDADGRVAAVKYGKHAYDQWSVDDLLAMAPRVIR